MKKSIFIIIFAFMLIGCSTTNQHKTEEINSLQNTQASGRLLECVDGSIYFTAHESDKLTLYHYDEDLTIISKRVIKSDDTLGDLYFLNIVDQYLYGYDYTTEALVKIDLTLDVDELATETVISHMNEKGSAVYQIFVQNSRLYEVINSINNSFIIVSYDLNGKDKKVEGETPKNDSFILDNNLYLSSHKGLYQDDEIFFDYHVLDYSINEIKMYNNYIYARAYNLNERESLLIRIMINEDVVHSEEDIEIVSDSDMLPMNFYKETMLLNEENKTYISALDGSGKELLYDGYNYSTLMSKNYIFIFDGNDIKIYDYEGNPKKIN